LYLLQFPDPFPAFVPDPSRSFLKDVDVDDLKPKSELSGDIPAESESASKEKDKAKKGVSFAEKDKDGAEVVVKKEDDKEKKAKDAKLKALMAKEKARKPEGRIGTMVVMKSGKVKMVLGDGIVMDVSPSRRAASSMDDPSLTPSPLQCQVSPGVSTTFVQQLVHMDRNKRNATVLGEVNKSFVMTPDIDRLLDELRLHDGVIPGEEVQVKSEIEL